MKTFLSVGGVAKECGATNTQIEWATKTRGVKPVAKVAGRYLWTTEQLPAIRRALADVRKTRQNAATRS